MDAGHQETERLIAEMERKVRKEYEKAVSEVQAKLDDYLRRFKIKDEIWRRRVKAGEVSEAEYKQWRLGQIAVGQRWEAMRDQLAADLHNANGIARSIVQGYMPEVYAVNHNFATFLTEKQLRVDTGFTLYRRETIERILREEPELLPLPGPQMNQTFAEWDLWRQEDSTLTPEQLARKNKIPESKTEAFKNLVKENKDVRWQKGQLQSCITQAVLQGESIPNISRRIAREMGEINHKSTIRYARTAMTGAQNAGRIDSFRRAKDLGIELEQEWIATVDHRTRHEHRLLDGQTSPVGEPFESELGPIMYPGDPSADPANIWNCRCTIQPKVKGWADMSHRSMAAIEDEMTFDEWKQSRDERPHSITKQEEIEAAMKRRYINKYYRGR